MLRDYLAIPLRPNAQNGTIVLGAPPQIFLAHKARATLQPSRLLDPSLRQGQGGVTVGRRSAAEIARREGWRRAPALASAESTWRGHAAQ